MRVLTCAGTGLTSGVMSMATPHVVGSAAQYVQTHPTATPQQVRDALYAATTEGIVTDAQSADNHLLFTQF